MNPKIQTKLTHQRGVLLLEVLIAIAIFSVGILGLIGLQASVIANSMNAEDRTQAALFADEIISQMWLKTSTTLPAADVSSWTAKVLASKIKAAGTVNVTGNVATVTLVWKSATKKTSENSNTYSTQVVIAQ